MKIYNKWLGLGLAIIINLCGAALYGMEKPTTKEYFEIFKSLPEPLQRKIQNLMMQDVITFLGTQPVTLEENFMNIHSIAINDTGNILVLGLDKGSLQRDKGFTDIWDIKNGKLIHTLQYDNGEVSSVAISGDIIVTGLSDGVIQILNINGTLLKKFKGHNNEIISLAMSGDIFVTGSADTTAKIWNINGQLLHTFEEEAIPNSVAISGNNIAIGLANDTTKTYTIDGQLVHTFDSGISPVAISGDTVVTRFEDKELRVSNINGKLQYTLKGFIYPIALSGNYLIGVFFNDQTIKIWNIKNGQLLHTLGQSIKKTDMTIHSIVIGGNSVVTRSSESQFSSIVKIWPISIDLTGTTQNNPLLWIITNANPEQMNLIKQAYEANITKKMFMLDKKDLIEFTNLPAHVKRYLLDRLKIRAQK